MKILPGSTLARLVQVEKNGAMDRQTMEEHVATLAARASFARAYLARGGRDANGQRLDPVLASHLGLNRAE